jgi:hypothetical protein
MRVTTLLISLGACALLIGGQARSSAAGAKENCKHPCVSVTPSTGDPETVFVFRGRGWVPNRRMSASYGVSCRTEPGETPHPCILPLLHTNFKTNDHGRFVFRFRNGPRPLKEVPPPRSSGGGPVTFRQYHKRGRAIKRTPRYLVDGEPPEWSQ